MTRVIGFGRLIPRLGSVLLLAVLGSAVVFFIMRAGQGDPALAVLGDTATPEAVAAFRLKYRLDDPLVVQFLRWLGHAMLGDFGTSLTVAGGTPIMTLIAGRLPNTLFIGVYALLIAVTVSLFAGTVSALRHGKFADTVSTSIAVLGISMPDFWLSYVLVYSLALGFGISRPTVLPRPRCP